MLGITITLLSSLGVGGFAAADLPTNNDPANQIRFNSTAEADAKRTQLINYIWNTGLPSTLPSVTSNVSFPGKTLDINPINVASVDRLEANVSGWGFYSNSYLMHPKTTNNANRLVVVSQGHADDLIGGVGATANHMLKKGFTVLVVKMPFLGGSDWNTDTNAFIPGQGSVTYTSHDSIISNTSPNNGGRGYRLFLEPIVQGINYVVSSNLNLTDVSMIGLSGGGWATSMMGALDQRIKLSVPVAGSAPLYVRNDQPGSVGDLEQFYSPLYDENIQPNGSGGGVATWLEIYSLGGYGPGRRQIDVTNEFDTCCFYGNQADSYKNIVANKVSSLGAGVWEHVLDSSHVDHRISNRILTTVVDSAFGILPASGGPQNLAPMGTVSASSVYGTNYEATNANDGIRAGDAIWHSSNTTADPIWYQVDLGANRYLDRVQIFPRNSEQGLVKNFRIDVFNTSNQNVFSQVFLPSTTTGDKAWGTTALRNVLGSRIRITREPPHTGGVDDAMTFGEFEVWGDTNPIPVNLAQGRPVTATPDAFGAPANNAVDGNIDGYYAHGSIYHADPNSANQFWQVELPTLTGVSSVNIFNRTDHFGNTTDFFVDILGADGSTLVASYSATFAATDLGVYRYDLTVKTAGEVGKYVRIRNAAANQAANALVFAEVEVFGTLPGDFNLDGNVDSADYVVWRKNPSTFGGNPGYDIWRSSFGNPPTGTGALLNGEAVPEPAAGLLACLALVHLAIWRSCERPRSK